MRDDDHGAVGRFETLDDFEHFARQFGVERAGRLVEAEDVRLEREGAGDRHALLLPAREFKGVGVALFGQADAREQLLRARGDALFALLSQHCQDILALRLQPPTLRLVCDPADGAQVLLFLAQRALGEQRLREGDVFVHRVLRKEVELLEHEAEVQPLFADLRVGIGALFGRVEENFAADGQRALVGRFQKVEAAQERRLAAAG